VRIDQAVVWEGAEALTPATAETLGQQLRERLRSARISPAPLLVCFGREQVILKEIHYPKTDPDQEPTLVRFQATKELTESPDNVLIDYVRLRRPGPSGEQVAHVLIARRDLVNAFKAMCKAAGLRLVALTPRAFGLAACLRQAAAAGPPEQGAAAVLAAAEGISEFCVAQGETLLAARPLPQANGGLVEDLRRNLTLYAGQPGGLPVQSLHVAGGDDTAGLRARLQEGLTIPVRTLDPLSGTPQGVGHPDRAGFAGPVGLLYLWSEAAELPANFMAPKEPRVSIETGRRRLLRVAGVGFLGLLLFFLLANVVLAVKRGQVEQLQEQRDEVDADLRRFQPDKKRIGDLKEWHQGALPVLDELYDLTVRFPFLRGLKVTKLEFASLAGKTGGREQAKTGDKGPPFTVRMTITGLVPPSQVADVRHLTEDFNKDSHCRADTPQITSAGGEKTDGAQQFIIHVDLRAGGAYRSLLVPPPRPKAVPADDDDDDDGWFGWE
jgi:hypothetical protein